MDKKTYIEQYREIEKISAGMTTDEIRKRFKGDISNDFIEGGVEILDVNFKDILVTFEDSGDGPKLSKIIEMYSEHDMFLGTTEIQ